jgi:hypothetical protein
MEGQSFFITIPHLNERWDMPEELVNRYWEYMKGLDNEERKEKYLTLQEDWYATLSEDDKKLIRKTKAYQS